MMLRLVCSGTTKETGTPLSPTKSTIRMELAELSFFVRPYVIVSIEDIMI